MDCFEAIKTRRSIRQFSSKPIPKADLLSLMDAGRYAATARGVEPWQFVAVTDQSILAKLGRMCEHGSFLAQAGACIAVFCTDTKYYLEDGCAATQNILVAARALGIGSCWVAGDKKLYCSQVCALLRAPKDLKLVSLIALGYPASPDAFVAKPKKEPASFTHWEIF